MMKRILLPGIFLTIVVLGLLILQPVRQAEIRAGIVAAPFAANLSSDKFERALGLRDFNFPADFGPHERFQTEWWYYTGSLNDENGRLFGYQLTFFRRGLVPPDELAVRGSEWAVNQVYLAHFTVSDIEADQFYYWEQSARGAAGLAGAQADPIFQVWLYDWKVQQAGLDTFQLVAQQEGIRLELQLEDVKGPVLHGENGYSQKGEQPGNASYYFSQTRLISRGKLVINDRQYTVTGTSWMDHEFSTSVLSGGQIGWDWFSLQLDDGREIMVYTIRRADGSLDPHSYGTLIKTDRSTRQLSAENFSIHVTKSWHSAKSDTDYPAGWELSIPDEKLVLQIEPLMADQELLVSFTYWEGAVQFQGTWGSETVSGRGYVELTGYAHSMEDQF
jgi:predicted secreted hydrolase